MNWGELWARAQGFSSEILRRCGLSAVLRAYGADFDVEEFLNGCTLPLCAVIRRGEPVFPSSQPLGRRLEWSGVHILVSDAEFEDFPRQTADAIVFLQNEHDQLRRLCNWPGVTEVALDFGIARREVPVQCDVLPSELVRLAGSLGFKFVISQYWAIAEGKTD